MIEPGLSALILRIGAADDGNWPALLDALAGHLRTEGAMLWQGARGWDRAGALEGGLPGVFLGLRPNRVYSGEELADRMPPGGAESGGAARLEGAADLRAIGLRPEGEGRGEGVPAWLALTRARATFRAVDSATLSALAPHLAQALARAARMRALAGRMDRAEALLARLGIGALDWDRQGRAVALDAVAGALLARLGAGPEAALTRPPAGTVHLALPAGVELLVLAPGSDPGSDPPAILRDAERPLPAPALLAAALGIAPAEARLARALAGGQSLRAAAASLGITEATARFYARQIYARTGLSGQPALMRRIWASALGLGLLG